MDGGIDFRWDVVFFFVLRQLTLPNFPRDSCFKAGHYIMTHKHVQQHYTVLMHPHDHGCLNRVWCSNSLSLCFNTAQMTWYISWNLSYFLISVNRKHDVKLAQPVSWNLFYSWTWFSDHTNIQMKLKNKYFWGFLTLSHVLKKRFAVYNF